MDKYFTATVLCLCHIHACSNFNSSSVKPPLEIGHGWVLYPVRTMDEIIYQLNRCQCLGHQLMGSTLVHYRNTQPMSPHVYIITWSLLVTKLSEINAWVSEYIHDIPWDAVTDTWPNFRRANIDQRQGFFTANGPIQLTITVALRL